jgi:GLPGLI family protein
MMKIKMLACAILLVATTNAQTKEGKVVYSRTMQMQIKLANADEHIQSMLPKSRTDNFELYFGNNQSLWRQAEKEDEQEDIIGGEGGGGIQIRIAGGGSDDVVYNDFAKGTRVELRDVMDKKFVIDDSIRPLKWKMTGETRTILNHNCMKATATNITRRTMTNIENGKFEKREVEDTANITAWFATDIPVAAGPAEYQGQLPGLILELDVNDGRQIFKALEFSPKTDLAVIKAPSGKKRYTPAEYKKEREKMMEEMQKNNGGQRTIRFN